VKEGVGGCGEEEKGDGEGEGEGSCEGHFGVRFVVSRGECGLRRRLQCVLLPWSFGMNVW
jgi:hypothetical protein